MALIGVILLLVGAGAAVVTYVGASAAGGTVALSAFGFTRSVSPFELAVYAAVAVLLLALGWAALSAAARRRARARRADKEAARLAAVEDTAAADRREHDKRMQEAGLRDEDLRRRESELTARHEGLDTREREFDDRDTELTRRESEWRGRQGPSVADVVAGRAQGSVHDGTAAWSDPTSDSHDHPSAEPRSTS